MGAFFFLFQRRLAETPEPQRPAPGPISVSERPTVSNRANLVCSGSASRRPTFSGSSVHRIGAPSAAVLPAGVCSQKTRGRRFDAKGRATEQLLKLGISVIDVSDPDPDEAQGEDGSLAQVLVAAAPILGCRAHQGRPVPGKIGLALHSKAPPVQPSTHGATSSFSHSLSRIFDSRNISQKAKSDTNGTPSMRSRCVRKVASCTLPC